MFGSTLVNPHIVYNQLAEKRIKNFIDKLIRTVLTADFDTDDRNVHERQITVDETRKSIRIHKSSKNYRLVLKVQIYC